MIRDLLCILVMCPVEAFGQKGLSLFNHHSSQPQSLVHPKSMHVEQVSTGEPHIPEYLEVWWSRNNKDCARTGSVPKQKHVKLLSHGLLKEWQRQYDLGNGLLNTQMPSSKGPWFLVWDVSLSPHQGQSLWLPASLGAVRGNLERAKFRGECSDSRGIRRVMILLCPAPLWKGQERDPESLETPRP